MFRTVGKLARTAGMLPTRSYLIKTKFVDHFNAAETRKMHQLAIASGVAVIAASAYVAYDYNQAITGNKKRDPNKPLGGLGFLYVIIARDENKRRQLGLIPEALFEAGEQAKINGNNPAKWFDKMLLVKPTSTELPFYYRVAEFYFSHNDLKKAIRFWEHITESDKMSPYYERAGDAYFKIKKLDEAEINWKKAELKDMPQRYAKLGQAFDEQNKKDQAISYLEKARKKGYQPYEVLMQLGQLYLTKDQKTHSDALELFKKTLSMDPNQAAISLNEMGVCVFMNAMANQDKKFREQQLEAISYLERAASSSPDNAVIEMNLSIVKALDEYPTYGYPHCLLQTKVDEPTAMIEAIKSELIRNKNKTVQGSGTGLGIGLSGPSYDDKGKYTGASPVFTVNDVTTSMEVPRYANERAIHKLYKFELRQELKKRATIVETRSAKP